MNDTKRNPMQLQIGEKSSREELEQLGELAKFYRLLGTSKDEYCDLPLSTFKETSPGSFERVE